MSSDVSPFYSLVGHSVIVVLVPKTIENMKNVEPKYKKIKICLLLMSGFRV